MDYINCPYCGKRVKTITPSHLKLHNKTIQDLKAEFSSQAIMCENTKREIEKNKKGPKIKKSIKYIKRYLLKNKIKYEIISKTYLNSFTPLKWKCKLGHIFHMTWTSFQQGTRCPICFGTPKKTIKDINDFLKSIKYSWISNEYNNIYSKLKVKCPKGHVSEIRFDQLQAGHRCHECHNEWKKINFSGNGNPNWRGGLSYEPYCIDWTKEYKDYIKERDDYKCLNPCCYSANPKNIVVHHIDYKKKNCDPYNLITLCNTCNTQANFNRNWHQSWYNAIIYRRYKI